MNNTIQFSAYVRWSLMAGCLLAACALYADHKDGHTKGGGGGEGSGGGPAYYARADFVNTVDFNIVEDNAEIFCEVLADGHPLSGGVWDYWDDDDVSGCDSATGVRQSDVNGGGRWIFSTGHSGPRWVTFYWEHISGSTDPTYDPNLDSFLHPDIASDEPFVDNLRMRLNADKLFKGGNNDRQPTTIEIHKKGGGRPWALVYHEDLYIVRDPTDPDIVCLTTEGELATEDGADPLPDLQTAELIDRSVPGESTIFGTYRMPLTIIVRRVAP